MTATTSNWKTDTFQDAYLKIEHSYFSEVYTDPTSPLVIKGEIKFSNTGLLSILDLNFVLNPDDNSATWEGYLTNAQGELVPDTTVHKIGNIPPGQSASVYTYWWKPKHLFGSSTKDFDVQFNIIPTYTIQYSGEADFRSTANVYLSKGKFEVPGILEAGIEFTNNHSKQLNFIFSPSGTWDCNPTTNPTVTAAGVPSANASGFTYPKNTPLALLAINKQTSSVAAEVGTTKTIRLNPGETLIFKMNDSPNGYYNNAGVITVNWSIQS